MSFTSPPGVEMLVILEKIQEIVDSGELLDYQPTYVTRYEVGDGGCNINLVTSKHPILTVALDTHCHIRYSLWHLDTL